jgi:ABC-type amino acid transport substrate-binding protein
MPMGFPQVPVSTTLLAGVVLVLAFGLGACDLPRDPNGTTEKVRDGELVVGIVEGSRYASLAGGTPVGEEVALVQAIARSFDAQLRWTAGTAAQIMTLLEQGRIDLAIGGIPVSGAWSSHFAPTAPVGSMPLGDETTERVFAVPMGENRWLFEVNKLIRSIGHSS